jgi:hypothetical protein
MDYDSMTVLDLKKVCKERGLKVSGSKDEVTIRLMEHDESMEIPIQPSNINYRGYAPNVNQQILSNPNVQRIYVTNNNGTASGIGTIIILYGIFRMFWALTFSMFGITELGWIVAPIAFLLSFCFIFSGVLTANGYLNGIYLSLVLFLISGLLSIVFGGGELNPLSISWADDGSMVLISFDELKPGWPSSIERLLSVSKGSNSKSDENKEIQCLSCKENLRVPVGYSGKVSCPHCSSKMTI